jgi:hypothetical protein
MHLVILLFKFLALTALIFLFMGMYKPWVMLWWEDVQNRKKVIKLYGSIAIVSYALYWLTILINEGHV